MADQSTILEKYQFGRQYLAELIQKEFTAMKKGYKDCEIDDIDCLFLVIGSLSIQIEYELFDENTDNLYFILLELLPDIQGAITPKDPLVDNGTITKPILLDGEVSFTALIDTPASYAGQAGKYVVVNETEDGLEFKVAVPGTGGGVLEEDIPATTQVGAADPGFVFEEGMSLTDVVRAIADKAFPPKLTEPSFSITTTPSYLQKIGSVLNIPLTFNFNRGQVLGNLVANVWNENALQSLRLGAAISYTINGVNQAGNQLTVNNHTIIKGLNTFTGKVAYGLGSQPVNSKSQPVGDRYPAGESNVVNVSLEGVYPLFATVTTLVIPNELPLYSMLTANNIDIDLVAESQGNKQFIEIPTEWLQARPLLKIVQFNTISNQFDTTNLINTYSQDIEFKDILGTNRSYTRFTNTNPDRGGVKIRLIFQS